jgi:hypothetical protein
MFTLTVNIRFDSSFPSHLSQSNDRARFNLRFNLNSTFNPCNFIHRRKFSSNLFNWSDFRYITRNISFRNNTSSSSLSNLCFRRNLRRSFRISINYK